MPILFNYLTMILNTQIPYIYIYIYTRAYGTRMGQDDLLSSVQMLSHVQLFETHGLQHTSPPCPSPTPGACSYSCPLSQWCHPTISSSVLPFSQLQSFPASESFQMSHFFTSGGQSIVASASVLPMNIWDWFPLGWTGWISLQSKGLSRVFSSTTVQKHMNNRIQSNNSLI